MKNRLLKNQSKDRYFVPFVPHSGYFVVVVVVVVVFICSTFLDGTGTDS